MDISGIPSDRWDSVRDDTLKENTAQAVYQALRQIESLSEKSSDRWLWELIQNAVDSARPAGIRIRVEYDESAMTFHHDGKPFTPKEIAHLIYYGTTKLGEGLIGQFGTGFLTTHVLSRKVRVSGTLDSGQAFAFDLLREGKSAEEIGKNMDDSWDEFKKSLHESKSKETSFEYVLDEGGRRGAERGIAGIHVVLPFVLAFNTLIRGVTIRDGDRIVNWTRGEETGMTPDMGTHLVRIHGDKEFVVAVAGDEETQVAVLLLQGEAQTRQVVLGGNGAPSVFSAFPLRGTAWFRLPCVVNSRSFAATPDRQGLVLGTKEEDVNRNNKRLFAGALDDIAELIQSLAEDCEFSPDAAMVDLPPGGDPDWLEDRPWLRASLEGLIAKLRGLSLVQTKTSRISMDTARVPLPDEGLDPHEMFRLASAVLQTKIPDSMESTKAWLEVLRGWSRVLEMSLPDLDQTLTATNLADHVKDRGDLKTLDGELSGSGLTSCDWINAFAKWCGQDQTYLDGMIPNQLGNLVPPGSSIFSDPGVDDELKDIADLVGYPLRSMLGHRDIAPPYWLKPLDRESTIGEVVRKLQEMAKILKASRVTDFELASGKLLAWLVGSAAWSKFDSKIPILVRGKATPTINYLVSGERLLAPPSVWKEGGGRFVDLFPGEFVLADVYGKWLDGSAWTALSSNGLVYSDPVFSVLEKLDAEDLEAMLVQKANLGGAVHGSIQAVQVTEIAFLALPKDKCVIDGVRTRPRAAEFLRFLAEHAIRVDPDWTKSVEVDCKCGTKHSVHPCQFMRYIRRKWIPIRTEGKDTEDSPTTENVLPLLQENGGIPDSLLDENGWEFLTRLGLIPLVFVAPDAATQQELAKVAKAMSENPDFQEQVHRAVRQRQAVRKNQALGARIQELIGKLIAERIDKAWKVVPNYNLPGYDYYVSEELDGETDAGRIEIAGNYLEVKATTESRARMTPTQASFAVSNADHYALCVVRMLPEDYPESIPLGVLETRITIISDIGKVLEESVADVDGISEEDENAQIWIENLGKIRYAVGKKVWETSGQTLVVWLESLSRSG